MPPTQHVLLRIAMLLGTLLGQLGFGFFADMYGRKHLYGYELLVLTVAAVGVIMSSAGAANSMSVFGWLFAWRVVMGIGITLTRQMRRPSANFSRHRRRLPPLGRFDFGIRCYRPSCPNDRFGVLCATTWIPVCGFGDARRDCIAQVNPTRQNGMRRYV